MEDSSAGTSPSPHSQLVAGERKQDAHSLRCTSRCHQLLAGLSGCNCIEWRLKPSASQYPHVLQPLLPLGHLHGDGGWGAAVCSLALTSVAPQAWHSPSAPHRSCVQLARGPDLSATSLGCCLSSVLVQDFKALSIHPSLFLLPFSP